MLAGGWAKPSPLKFRFGPFELDGSARELRKHGVKLKLEPAPYKLLVIFLERPRQALESQALKELLWPESRQVDDANLRKMVERLRAVLLDNPSRPKYIETINTFGYKFIADVQVASSAPTSRASTLVSAPAVPVPTSPAFHPGHKTIWVYLSFLLAAIVIPIAVVRSTRGAHFSPRDQLLIADFENQTGDPKFDGSLLIAFTVALEQNRYASVYPRSRLASALERMGLPAASPITTARGLDLCRRESIRALISPSITRAGNHFLVAAQIIDPQTAAHVRAYAESAVGDNQLLPALEKLTADLRVGLGESLANIQQTERPLPQVTTPSFVALKSYAEGVSLWRHGSYKEAIHQFQSALEADGNFAMAHAALGNANCSYILNNPAGCRSEYEKALSLTNRMTGRERKRIQADYAIGMNHADGAETSIVSYLRLYPDDPDMISSYGYFLRTHQRMAEAVTQYQRLLQITPNDAPTYVDLATCYKGFSDYPNALRAYQAAIRLEPQKVLDDATLSREYGFTLVAHGDETKAEEIFIRQLARTSTREAGLRSLALLDVLHGRCLQARARFEDALRIDEARSAELSVLRIHLWLASISDLLGDRATQRKHLDAAAAKLNHIGPKAPISAWLGDAYLRAGCIRQAQRILRALAAGIDPANRTDVSYLHFLQAAIEIGQHRPVEAISLLQLSLEEDEDRSVHPFALPALALAAQQADRPGDEIAAYEKALAVPLDRILWEPLPVWLNAHYALASAYRRGGQTAQARAILDQLLTLWKSADSNLPLLGQSAALRATLAP